MFTITGTRIPVTGTCVNVNAALHKAEQWLCTYPVHLIHTAANAQYNMAAQQKQKSQIIVQLTKLSQQITK